MPDPKNVQDILQELSAKKSEYLVKTYKELKKVTQFKSISLEEKLVAEEAEAKLKTGTLIDDIIGGGLESGSSMLLFGEFGSGKTQTCFTMAVECPDIVIYIDPEDTFKAKRIKQICDARGLDYKKAFSKIILYQPKNWLEQMMLLYKLPAPSDVGGKIGLIIIDSLTKLFRGVEFAGRQSLTVKQPLIREYMLKLKEIARIYGCALIFTTQIYRKPQTSSYLPDWTAIQAVGGDSMLHQADYIIFFRKGSGNNRIARLMDSSWNKLAERPLRITVSGIIDLPKTDKAEELIERTKQFEKKQQLSLGKEKEDGVRPESPH